jgi:hypothetical protein
MCDERWKIGQDTWIIYQKFNRHNNIANTHIL